MGQGDAVATTMRIGDKITIPTGRWVKHTRVLLLQTDLPDTFRVTWRSKYGRGSSIRTLRYVDEGVRWMQGHLESNSEAAQALCVAQAFVGESPWKENV